jgi:hypothetical protein
VGGHVSGLYERVLFCIFVDFVMHFLAKASRLVVNKCELHVDVYCFFIIYIFLFVFVDLFIVKKLMFIIHHICTRCMDIHYFSLDGSTVQLKVFAFTYTFVALY